MRAKINKLIKWNVQQILFIFFAFFTMVLVSYIYVSNIVQQQMYDLGEETIRATETALSSSISDAELVFANIAHGVEKLLAEDKTKDEILAYLQETNSFYSMEDSLMPDFMKVYGYFGGEFLDGSNWIPGEGYRPMERPWYLGAVQNHGGIFCSEPYEDADTGEMCISFSRMIEDKNEVFYGVLAIDINLSRITDFVKEQRIADEGYGVLVSDTLHFTIHKDDSLIGTHIADAGRGYTNLANMMEEGKLISAERFKDVDGTDSVAFFKTIFYGWHIGIIIPRSGYYAQVYQMGIVLALLGAFLLVVLSSILIRSANAKMRSDEESKSKSDYLAHMSHEMRTPMNAIIGMTDIARGTTDPVRIKYCLDKINDAAGHLLGVINDVLDMSKIEAGKLELFISDFTVTEMLNRAIAIVELKLEEKQQEFIVTVNDNVPKAIISDMQRLTQVITNLISNANKFTPEHGKISLTVNAAKNMNGDCILEFEVADDGIGISKQQQEMLFHSFEQADGNISRKYGGTGLGLAISQKIVEMLNGKIRIESELGQGAKFIFTIRAKVGEANEKTESEKGVNGKDETGELLPIFHGKSILLAEDIEINREILIAMVSETGVEVRCAADGREAVNMFMEEPDIYDMIFMDVHMPDMDGYEATECIRAIENVQARNIPIIAMSANVFKEDIDKCLAVGMNGHVGKPLDKKEIIKVMEQYII